MYNINDVVDIIIPESDKFLFMFIICHRRHFLIELDYNNFYMFLTG